MKKTTNFFESCGSSLYFCKYNAVRCIQTHRFSLHDDQFFLVIDAECRDRSGFMID